uniref:Uncharacterized protein n=1 Tax=Setaria digitata TaxID=48799 RepID=A0A915PVQ4_9BILA
MIYSSSAVTQSTKNTKRFPQNRSRTPVNASILDVAECAGILLLNPSDLVFKSSITETTYYDFVISTARQLNGTYQLFLSKFDADTNLEWMETANVTGDMLTSYNLPDCELPLILLGMLMWKVKIQNSKVLCLVKAVNTESTQTLEALKKVAEKFNCHHHVVTANERKLSSGLGRLRLYTPQNGMRLRVTMCQTRSQVEITTQALRETRCLLFPNSRPLLCLCSPLI